MAEFKAIEDGKKCDALVEKMLSPSESSSMINACEVTFVPNLRVVMKDLFGLY